jgi:hypothetical protein
MALNIVSKSWKSCWYPWEKWIKKYAEEDKRRKSRRFCKEEEEKTRE